MPEVSTYSKIPYPTLTDPANAPSAFGAMASHLDKRVINQFVDEAAREAQITQAQEGMVIWQRDLNRLQVGVEDLSAPGNYRWENVGQYQRIYKLTLAQSFSTATVAAVNDIMVQLWQGYTYRFELFGSISGPTNTDVRVQWGGVTGPTYNRHVMGPAPSITNTLSAASVRMGVHGMTTPVIYGTDGTNVGSFRETFLVKPSGNSWVWLEAGQGTEQLAELSTLTASTICLVTQL